MALYQNKPYPIQQGPDAEKIDYNFDTLWQYLRSLQEQIDDLSGSGSATPHHILSTTHDDSIVDTPVAQDFIVYNGGWTRFPIGGDNTFLVVIAGVATWTTLTVALLPHHNLLSATHGDTTVASPVRGDVVTAQVDTVSAIDASKYYLDGFRLKAVSSVNDPGSQKYWFDGFRMPELVSVASISAVTWRKKAVGTPGQFLGVTADGLDTQFLSLPSSAGDCARVYQTVSQGVAWNTPTAMIFSTVEFDTASFFAAAAPTRFTAPAAGYYIVMGQITAPDTIFGLSYVQIWVNGAMKASFQNGLNNVDPAYGDYDPAKCVTIVSLNAGDYVELYWMANRFAGVLPTTVPGSNRVWMGIARIK